MADLEQVFLSSLDESGYLPQYRFASSYNETKGLMKRVSAAMATDKGATKLMNHWRQEPPAWASTNSDAVRMERKKKKENSKLIFPPQDVVDYGDEYSQAGVFVQVLQSNIRRNKRHIQKAFRVTLGIVNFILFTFDPSLSSPLLGHAVDRCYVTSPYFLPSVGVKRALLQAADRDTNPPPLIHYILHPMQGWTCVCSLQARATFLLSVSLQNTSIRCF